jgi:hypothetical protein
VVFTDEGLAESERLFGKLFGRPAKQGWRSGGGQVVVDAEPAILNVAAQRIPSAQRILERLAEWCLSGKPSSLHHRPGVERTEQRLASRLLCRQALLDGLAVDVGLNEGIAPVVR